MFTWRDNMKTYGNPDNKGMSYRKRTIKAPLSHSDESGFTLIELLVVILVIGILAAVAIPVFLNQRAKANDAAVVSDLKNAGMLLEGQGKFTGTLPADFVSSKGVTVTATRTSDKDNQIKVPQFVDGASGTWGTFIAPSIPATATHQIFTTPADGYKGMNYRRVSVLTGVNGMIGQNVHITLPEQGKKDDKYTIGVAMRHNYTGCRTIHIEFKNLAGAWPGGSHPTQACFTKDQWQYYETTATMTGDGTERVYLSMFGSMSAGQNMDVTGAAMVKGDKIDINAALDTSGNDFCLLGRHENNAGKLWHYSSLDGGISAGSC